MENLIRNVRKRMIRGANELNSFFFGLIKSDTCTFHSKQVKIESATLIVSLLWDGTISQTFFFDFFYYPPDFLSFRLSQKKFVSHAQKVKPFVFQT